MENGKWKTMKTELTGIDRIDRINYIKAQQVNRNEQNIQ